MVALGKADAGGSPEFELSMVHTADPTSTDRQSRVVLHSPGAQACGAISLGHTVLILHAGFCKQQSLSQDRAERVIGCLLS